MALRFESGIDSSGPRLDGRGRRGTRAGRAEGSAFRRPSTARGSGRSSDGVQTPGDSSARRRSPSRPAKPAAGDERLEKLRKKNARQRGKKAAARRSKGQAGPASAGGGRRERIGDIRAREREERAKRARATYRRYVARILLGVAAVLAVFFGAIFLYRSDVLLIRNVQVEGTSHLTSQEIAQLAAVPDDATLLRVDTDGIVERLKGSAWVQDASVRRDFPDALTISITERTPGAVVKISDKKTWVVSTDGSWLSAATAEDWDSQMRIVDVTAALTAPVSGSDCNDGGIKNALAIMQAISPDLKEQINDISAESSVKTALNLKNGVTVAFGDSNDADLKEADIWALLAQYEGKVSYINVRVPARPTFRTLDQ